MPEYNILNFLAAGGDVAIFAFLYLFWRFDRRLLKLEITLTNLLKSVNGEEKD